MIKRPSKFLREIAAQMLVAFCTESTKGTCQDTPPLPPTTSLQEDPSPQIYRGRSEGWSTTDEEKHQLSSRSPSPDYIVGIHGPSTQWRDEPIHNLLEDQNILGSSRIPVPTSRRSEGRPPSSPRRSRPSVARPLVCYQNHIPVSSIDFARTEEPKVRAFSSLFFSG
jgi:hypothetical protein